MERPPVSAELIRHLGLKVGLLLALTAALVIGFVGYVLYARGVFEPTTHLTLVAENAEGVSVGMDLTFAGFPVGRVHRIRLGEDGRARIEVKVPQRDARWLRASSVFTLERSLVGGAKLRAFTGNLEGAPLPDGAERDVLRGDLTEEIPRMVATVRTTLESIERMTGEGSSLRASIENLRALTERLAGPTGVLGALLGSEAEVKKVSATLAQAQALAERLVALTARVEGTVAQADRQLFGPQGITDRTGAAIGEAGKLLQEVRGSLKRVDAILVDLEKLSGDAKAIGADAKAIGGDVRAIVANVRPASEDLVALRAEVEASLRKLDHLIGELNRKWPFARETEITLP